jgi:hypothetical protein
MSADPAMWLVQEVMDLLDAASVGLYEFIWLLRGAYPDMSDAELRVHAGEALERLQKEGAGRLVWLTWPSEDVVARSAAVGPEPRDWRDPSDGEPYLAFARS